MYNEQIWTHKERTNDSCEIARRQRARPRKGRAIETVPGDRGAEQGQRTRVT